MTTHTTLERRVADAERDVGIIDDDLSDAYQAIQACQKLLSGVVIVLAAASLALEDLDHHPAAYANVTDDAGSERLIAEVQKMATYMQEVGTRWFDAAIAAHGSDIAARDHRHAPE